MQILRHCAAAALLLCLCEPGSAGASPWSATTGAAIRLVPGSSTPGERSAGLEIRLDPGWKTYWRNPGDSGVPPVFDWSGSDNVADVTVLWPAPQRFDDEDGVTIGYKADTVLPLKVEPKDATRPATLSLALGYAVCKTICVPAKGEARLTLDPAIPPDASAQALLATAQAAVPQPRALGAAGAPAVLGIAVDGSAKPLRLTVTARASSSATLFVDGPPDWYLAVPQAAGADGEGRRFTLTLDGLPKSAETAGQVLRFTLVDEAGAIETPYTLP